MDIDIERTQKVLDEVDLHLKAERTPSTDMAACEAALGRAEALMDLAEFYEIDGKLEQDIVTALLHAIITELRAKVTWMTQERTLINCTNDASVPF